MSNLQMGLLVAALVTLIVYLAVRHARLTGTASASGSGGPAGTYNGVNRQPAPLSFRGVSIGTPT